MDQLQYVAERISKLRTDRNESARDMSISMGHSVNYINHIENRKTEPSLSALFNILDYLGVSPIEFFDTGNPHPIQLNDVIEDLKQFNANELLHLSNFVKEILKNRK